MLARCDPNWASATPEKRTVAAAEQTSLPGRFWPRGNA
jgi:hypothetical protein